MNNYVYDEVNYTPGRWVPITPAMLGGAAAGAVVNRSGTITAGGTAQQLMAANALRRGFSVQNLSTGDLWVNATGTASAAAGSIKLPAGALYESPPGAAGTGAISIFGATTGQAFTAREY